MEGLKRDEKAKILLVDDEPLIVEGYSRFLRKRGFTVSTAFSGMEGLERAGRESFDLVITDLKMPDIDGLELTERIREADPGAYVIVITAFGTVETALKAVELGACDYLCKPFSNEQLFLSVVRALEHGRLLEENLRLKREMEMQRVRQEIIGRCPDMMKILKMIELLGKSDVSVLIQGESGTGKELIARKLHEISQRGEGPFIAIDCAAIPSTLLESELFGYEKGAFTGAVTSKKGLFELAHGGTLFLDEIGEMGRDMQTALLRAIEERRLRRLGGTRGIDIDIRLITATNRRLERLVAEGGFREDLYYRLNVMRIDIPPLRDRRDDIPLLSEHLLRDVAGMEGKPGIKISAEVYGLFLEYPWPGNVRELKNVIHHAVILCDKGEIGKEHLPPQFFEDEKKWGALPHAIVREPDVRGDLTYREARKDFLIHFERRYISHLLKRFGNHLGKTAEFAGIDRKTLRKILKRIGMT